MDVSWAAVEGKLECEDLTFVKYDFVAEHLDVDGASAPLPQPR